MDNGTSGMVVESIPAFAFQPTSTSDRQPTALPFKKSLRGLMPHDETQVMQDCSNTVGGEIFASQLG